MASGGFSWLLVACGAADGKGLDVATPSDSLGLLLVPC